MVLNFRSVVGCLVLFLFSVAPRLGAEVETSSSIRDRATPLVVGHTMTLQSSILDEKRDILISLPGDDRDPTALLPVVYVLDGRTSFLHTTAAVELLRARGKIPRCLVVGIPNTERSRDFTAVRTERRPSGGADRFLDFIELELVPFIEGNFRTARHRTLIGHSLGGLLAFHAIVERPGLFDAAIAISPGITNDERVSEGTEPLSKRLGAALDDRREPATSLFITMSDEEDLRSVEDLGKVLDVLRSQERSVLTWEYRGMPGEDHATTVHPSTYNGLRWIHADWDVEDLLRDGNLVEVTSRYRNLSERFGYEVRPPELLLNLVGYRLLGDGRGSEAIAVFERNTVLYPGSANVYDSLGEALEKQGKLPGALLNYRHAVSRAEATGDGLLPVYRANLDRVEQRLYQRGSANDPDSRTEFEKPPGR